MDTSTQAQSPLISVITIVYNDIAHIIETMDSVIAQDYPQLEYIIIDGASSDGTAQSPLISVITIVYNDIAHIIETMDSVIAQDYPQLEYIIIDGASSDGTKEAIMRHIQACAKVDSRGKGVAKTTHAHNEKSGFYLEATHKEKNLTFKFLSQKDSGIYEAMNKGTELATGQWCNFMNCGDRFYSPNALKEFFAYFSHQSTQGSLQTQPQITPQILYGDSQLIYDDTHSKILYASTKSHKYRHHFIHQSAFIATPLMQAYRYDTSFKIAGDTDFFAKAYNNGVSFYHIPLVYPSIRLYRHPPYASLPL